MVCMVVCSPGESEAGSSVSSSSRTSSLIPLWLLSQTRSLWAFVLVPLSFSPSGMHRLIAYRPKRSLSKGEHLSKVGSSNGTLKNIKKRTSIIPYGRPTLTPPDAVAAMFLNYKKGKVIADILLEAIQNNARELFRLILVPSSKKNIMSYDQAN